MSDQTENPVNPGKLLKSAREAMGLSLSDVATSTKINIKVLTALEEGRLSDLPAKSFARGFVRSYAQYLKIDPQPIIEGYQLDDRFISNQGRPEVGADGQPVPAAAASKTTDDPGISIDWGSRAFLVAAILILIVLIFGVKSIVDKYARERDMPPVVTTESGTPVITSEAGPPIENQNEGEIPPTENETVGTPAPTVVGALAVATTTVTPTTAPTVTVTPAPTVKVSPTPKPSPTSKPTATPKPTTAPAPTVANAAVTVTPKPTAAPKAEEILLEALDKVEIEIVLDGGSTQKLTLEPGTVKAYKFSQSLDVQISDGGLVNVIRNGTDLGNAGDLGRKARLKYP